MAVTRIWVKQTVTRLPFMANAISFEAMTVSTTRYLDRPGGRIGYDVRGDGPLIVAAPGMGDVRSVYRFLAPELAAGGNRIATIDLRGHGDSDTTFDSYDDEAAGSDLVALVRHLDAGPAVLVGNSMTGAAAVWAAAEHPELVRAVVLLGAFVRDPATSPVQRLAMNLALRRPWGGAAFAAFYRSLYPGTKPNDLDDHVGRIRDSLRRPGAWSAFVQTTRTSHATITPLLSKVTAPALVVMGERDPDFPDPAAEAEFTARALGGPARVVMIPGAGHYPQAQHPDLVTPAVVDFVTTVTHG